MLRKKNWNVILVTSTIHLDINMVSNRKFIY
uniref:Uncharacterized protein n=1 Tax=viral metagenome TaxID=1070528 RepID=A0A6C0EFU4_9ZZZZ